MEVAEGTKITIYVSKGSDKITVPSLQGRTKEDAARILSDAQLSGSISGEEFSDEYEEGQIISQSPAAGEKVPKNTVITYVVSKGKEEPDEPDEPDDPNGSGNNQGNQYPPGYTVTVPDVSYRSVDWAMSKLAESGLSGVVVEYRTSNQLSEGYVISQTVSGEASPGTTVGLIVSSGLNH